MHTGRGWSSPSSSNSTSVAWSLKEMVHVVELHITCASLSYKDLWKQNHFFPKEKVWLQHSKWVEQFSLILCMKISGTSELQLSYSVQAPDVAINNQGVVGVERVVYIRGYSA